MCGLAEAVVGNALLFPLVSLDTRRQQDNACSKQNSHVTGVYIHTSVG